MESSTSLVFVPFITRRLEKHDGVTLCAVLIPDFFEKRKKKGAEQRVHDREVLFDEFPNYFH